MMFLFLYLFTWIFGTLYTLEANIDINRIQIVPKAEVHSNTHERCSAEVYRPNDYDDSSSGQFGEPPALRAPVPAATRAQTAHTIKAYAPREDPRIFYQSDSYIEEINRKNLNKEVTYIYPGREVVRANRKRSRSETDHFRDGRERNMVNVATNCIRCPHDRTLVAKTGSDRVLLHHPRLLTCSGQKAPRSTRFVHMYGPKFGSLLEKGSHMVVGRVVNKNKHLQLCKMQVHVVTQGCSTAPQLKSHCTNQNCTFTCADPKAELHGPSSLVCGDNMDWIGNLPVCKARTWCEPPSPPQQGRVSCKGQTVGRTAALAEGARCRLRCPAGWRWQPRAAAICRRGQWTHSLACHRIGRTKHDSFE